MLTAEVLALTTRVEMQVAASTPPAPTAVLVALGVGAIIGTGIYTLTGVAAGLAGPAVILSFVVAGAVCAFAALCYAEMATMIPAAPSVSHIDMRTAFSMSPTVATPSPSTIR